MQHGWHFRFAGNPRSDIVLFQIVESGGDESVEGFCNCIRLAWGVFLMLLSSSGMTVSPLLNSSYPGNSAISSVLDQACDSNSFKFLVTNILKSPAFQVCSQHQLYQNDFGICEFDVHGYITVVNLKLFLESIKNNV